MKMFSLTLETFWIKAQLHVTTIDKLIFTPLNDLISQLGAIGLIKGHPREIFCWGGG